MSTLLLRNRIINHGPIKDWLKTNGYHHEGTVYDPKNFTPYKKFKKDTTNVIYFNVNLDENSNLEQKNGMLHIDTK